MRCEVYGPKADETSLIYIESTGKSIELSDTYFDIDALNGAVHEINNLLVYNKQVVSMIKGKRLRMEAACFFPEFTNNNMRGNGVVVPYYVPPHYVNRIEMSEGTDFFYLNADDRYEDFQGDEIFLKGLYDFEITTPVVPAGTYEVRFAYQPTPHRGAAQMYWDGKPVDIPLDLKPSADDAKIGFEVPGSNTSDPMGFENDKMMRNRGYMKGAASYRSVDKVWYPAANARRSNRSLRKILGIFTFETDATHRFKVVAARSGQFMMDYLEFVPLEVIESEDIY